MNKLVTLAVAAATVSLPSLASAHLSDLIYQGEGGKEVVVVEQDVKGVRPEMLDWWWDNIGNTDRFQLWHPTEHVSFQWLTQPADPRHLGYSPGAVQLTAEYIGEQAVTSKVTLLEPPQAHACSAAESTVVARLEYPDQAGNLGAGQIRYDYSGNDADDGVVLRTQYVLPEGIATVYPGYVEALAAHIKQEMQSLPDFLPDLFQQEYLEGELLTRGSYEVVPSGWLTKKVIVDQEIIGITPDMLDWWWDNINTTRRYKGWHPTAHVSFEWREAPSQPDQLAYSVGAVQLVTEYIGTYKSNLLITWLDPAEVQDQVEYDHWIYAKTDLKELRGIFPQRMIHQYQSNEAGDGIVMRSTFTVPNFFDFFMPGFSARLAEHAQQEMQFLPEFLPDLFAREYTARH